MTSLERVKESKTSGLTVYLQIPKLHIARNVPLSMYVRLQLTIFLLMSNSATLYHLVVVTRVLCIVSNLTIEMYLDSVTVRLSNILRARKGGLGIEGLFGHDYLNRAAVVVDVH